MMKTFSIAELEQFSLIKAHTFRTWEKRFGIGKTKRTITNIRFYTIDDLSFLLDLSLLNRVGYKVSSLVPLERDAILQKVLQLKDNTAKQEHQINRLIISMFALDIEDFELILDSAVSWWGIDSTIVDIVLPFLERLDLFSYKGHTSSEYHFVITAIRKKIHLAIEQAHPKELLNKSALLFLPKGEHYDLLLLYVQYKLRKAGFNILYLGTNVSVDNLETVVERKRPNFLVTYLSTTQEDKIKELKDYLEEKKAEVYFIIGRQSLSFANRLNENITYVSYKEADSKILTNTQAFIA